MWYIWYARPYLPKTNTLELNLSKLLGLSSNFKINRLHPKSLTNSQKSLCTQTGVDWPCKFCQEIARWAVGRCNLWKFSHCIHEFRDDVVIGKKVVAWYKSNKNEKSGRCHDMFLVASEVPVRPCKEDESFTYKIVIIVHHVFVQISTFTLYYLGMGVRFINCGPFSNRFFQFTISSSRCSNIWYEKLNWYNKRNLRTFKKDSITLHCCSSITIRTKRLFTNFSTTRCLANTKWSIIRASTRIERTRCHYSSPEKSECGHWWQIYTA